MVCFRAQIASGKGFTNDTDIPGDNIAAYLGLALSDSTWAAEGGEDVQSNTILLPGVGSDSFKSFFITADIVIFVV